jgi:uncharacterized protein YbgA (DUF1722 family)/uncharacterized protein YbbK (DUF523 family)
MGEDSRQVENRVRLGISSCLLGNKVRYDGGHKLDRYLANTLGQFSEFVPVCPEVECGFPIPRESLRLVGDADCPRLVTTRTGQDFTERMTTWAARRVVELEREGLCGFIFKSGSPSSGMQGVKLYDRKGYPSNRGVGMFAAAFMKHFPLVPVEQEDHLHDPRVRENFIERVFAFQRLRGLLGKRKSLGRLVDFHTRHKLQILSHSPKDHQAMGRLVARGAEMPPAELYDAYQGLFMKALSLTATVKKHTSVLTHMMGYFKKELSSDEKQELLEIIERYRKEYVPLVVPITMIKHYVRKYDQPYLKVQHYLNPHPVELQLRNHV